MSVNWSPSSGEDFRWGLYHIYGHGSHLGHVTSILLGNFHILVPKSVHIKIDLKNAVVSEKASINFHMLMSLGQGQEMTFTNTHITLLTQLVVCV